MYDNPEKPQKALSDEELENVAGGNRKTGGGSDKGGGNKGGGSSGDGSTTPVDGDQAIDDILNL